MRKLGYLLIPFLVFSLFTPSPVFSQETFQSRLGGGLNVGFARFPDNENDLGTGFNIRAYGEYLFTPQFSFMFSGGFMEFDENITLGSGTFSTTEPTRFQEAYVTGGIRARFSLLGGLMPFATVNAGLYNGQREFVTLITGEIADTTTTIQSNDFGFNFGGGIDYFLNKNISLNVEILLHSIQGDIDEEILDITGGLRYTPFVREGR